MEKIDIKSLELEQLKGYIVSLGAKPFVAGQIYSWLHRKNVDSFDEMTNISKSLREKLAEECYITV
ncbi:MAG: 23S rRNA (adenine(2503)-C(2))-methyltransferase RlmN, partial [Oscillospiraceae bacterium]|nr:23S rRNA (adenine(2503)-C(2))-methyltransferase RlmN [Oscillospiraceae bacterium]